MKKHSNIFIIGATGCCILIGLVIIMPIQHKAPKSKAEGSHTIEERQLRLISITNDLTLNTSLSHAIELLQFEAKKAGLVFNCLVHGFDDEDPVVKVIIKRNTDLLSALTLVANTVGAGLRIYEGKVFITKNVR